jgi:hypothetical protein
MAKGKLNTPHGPKAKTFLQRYARRVLGGCEGQLANLFTAAGVRLGVEWRGSRAHGYELLAQLYTQSKGVSGVTKDRGASKPKHKLAFAQTDEFLTSYEWRRLRMEVLIEQGRRCQCCGATPDNGAVMHVDHIKPRKLFPELALEKSNLQVLCDVCNHGKGNWDQTDWKAQHIDPAKVMPVWSKRVN